MTTQVRPLVSSPSRRRRPRLASRRLRPLVALSALALALTGAGTLAACGLGDSTPQATPLTVDSANPAPVPDGLERFYAQDLDWFPCAGGDSIDKTSGDADFRCATVEVPLDYADPDGQTITLALKKRPAGKDRIGSLLINPGGPGGSGLELVSSASGYFSDGLMDAYDVVGFDPRGVGVSTPVDCLSDAERDALRAGEDLDPAAQLSPDELRAEVVDQATDLEQACQARTQTAGLLDHIDTVSAARDLDVLRAVLGEARLSYLGFSYGTYLGATYADLFPGNVGRMVLDGAIDPTLTGAELAAGQAAGFESALATYVEDCQAGSSCPLSGGTEGGLTQVRQLLERAATSSVPTSDPDRPLTGALAEAAIIGALYQDENWSVLTEGLNQAMLQNDGSTLLYIADVLASRNGDGTYTGNGDEVINAINCLDYPVTGDVAQWDAQAAELEQVSPTFGADLAYTDQYCQAWGHPSTRAHTPIRAEGAPTILVLGTTGDPATPYAWSQALASQLADARLVTWEGKGHTAYGRAGGCVTEAVDSFLLAGTVPESDLTCPAS